LLISLLSLISRNINSFHAAVNPNLINNKDNFLLKLRLNFPELPTQKIEKKIKNGKYFYLKKRINQNDKEKFVNLKLNKKSKKYDIKGSSFNGEATTNNVIGNWWNHKILQAGSQVSPISGSIKEQVVTFIGKEKIDLYGKIYDVDHFTLKSKDMNIPKDKRLDFDIWYDQKNLRILKVSYSRMGNWEYRLKNFE